MNPDDVFQYRDGELFCEEVPIARLADEFQTPLWVYSKAHLLQQLGAFRTAFAAAGS